MREVRGEYERCGVRVITYDRPGYGRSTRLKGRSIADAAGDVVAIADHLGLDQFGVIGVSGGGPHALAVAAKAPERVTRCATIVSGAPYDADGLDYFADMPGEEQRAYDRLPRNASLRGSPGTLKRRSRHRRTEPQAKRRPHVTHTSNGARHTEASGPIRRTVTAQAADLRGHTGIPDGVQVLWCTSQSTPS
jgi:pimeloyl-ACP methyl ester carboxylesterase